MGLKIKAKNKRYKDLWQAVGEQDVLILRDQLTQIQNSRNKSPERYGMNALEDFKI